MTVEIVTRELCIRAKRLETREADFVASTDAVDAYDEIVAQNWDLDRFKANPVILWAHNSRELPIGKATRCEMVGGRLECTIKFASEKANPQAEQVWQLVQDDMLRAVSVGFYPRTVRSEKRDDKDVYVLDDNELHEISVVPVPANPEALAKMKQRALERAHVEIEAMTLKEMQDRAEVAEKLAKDHEERAAAAENASKALKVESEKLAADLASEKAAHVATTEKLAAATKAQAEAADALLVKEVDALVGVKFTPAERDAQLEFARANPEMFKKLADARPALAILGSSVVTPEATPLENTATDPGDGGSLAAEVKQLAAKKPDAPTAAPWG
ncbi:MAG TPA: HK97 family phage prohead protease [Polyangiaceae bacterium]|jgi:HK97 family phage prohead protease